MNDSAQRLSAPLHLEPLLPKDWGEFYANVATVARATRRDPDRVTMEMYHDDVRELLGDLPTPPWHLSMFEWEPTLEELIALKQEAWELNERLPVDSEIERRTIAFKIDLIGERVRQIKDAL